MTKICFDKEEFEKWINSEIFDEQISYKLEDGNIISRWTSYINGIWEDHEDIELKGEIIE